MKESEQGQYNELGYYTLAHHDSSFIHQLVVDAFTAQNADEKTKTIAIAFALIELYLYVEENYSGKHGHEIHMNLAAKKKTVAKVPFP